MGIIAIFLLALLISALFSSGYRRDGSWGFLIIFFLILFMAGVAGQFWIVPFGPIIWGISFLPILFFIVIVAFLFVASAPPPQRTVTKTEKAEDSASFFATISIFIWFLFCAFLIAIVAGYYK